MVEVTYELSEKDKKNWSGSFGDGGLRVGFPATCEGLACWADMELLVYAFELDDENDKGDKGDQGGDQWFSSGPLRRMEMHAKVELSALDIRAIVRIEWVDERITEFSPESCATDMLARSLAEAARILVRTGPFLAMMEAKELAGDLGGGNAYKKGPLAL